MCLGLEMGCVQGISTDGKSGVEGWDRQIVFHCIWDLGRKICGAEPLKNGGTWAGRGRCSYWVSRSYTQFSFVAEMRAHPGVHTEDPSRWTLLVSWFVGDGKGDNWGYTRKSQFIKRKVKQKEACAPFIVGTQPITQWQHGLDVIQTRRHSAVRTQGPA